MWRKGREDLNRKSMTVKHRSLMITVILGLVTFIFFQSYLRARSGINIPYLTFLLELVAIALILAVLFHEKKIKSIHFWSLYVLTIFSFIVGTLKVSHVGGFQFSFESFPVFISLIAAFYSAYFLFLYEKVGQFIYLLIITIYLDFFLFFTIGGNVKTDFFVGASYNFTSSLLLFLSMAITTFRFYKSKQVLIWPAIIALAYCVYVLDARASLVISALFFLAVILKRYGAVNKLMIVGISCIFLFVLFLIADTIYQMFIDTRLGARGLDSPRWVMWKEYFQKLDLMTFIFGLDLDSVESVKVFNLNPHNSLIKLHSNLGMLAVLLFSWVLIQACRGVFNNRAFPAIIFILMMARCLTDSLVFPGLLSILFFIIYFSLINKLGKSPAR